MSSVEKPARMLHAVSAMAAVLAANTPRRAFRRLATRRPAPRPSRRPDQRHHLRRPGHAAGYAQHGRLDPVVLSLPRLHNDALQALATGGVAGFVVWVAPLAAPGLFFLRQLDAGMRARQFAPALAGALVVCSYACFGLTEVIFRSVAGSLFYALMVFTLMGLCLNAKEKIG
jgi:hypothetical protein